MSKLFRTLALTALLAGATSAVTVAPAQDKGKPAKKDDDDKKAEKKDTAKKAKKATGGVEVLETKTGKWYFKVVDADGKMLAMSPTSKYAEKADAVKAFEELKDVLESAKLSYPVKKSDDKDDDKDDKKDKKETKKDKKG